MAVVVQANLVQLRVADAKRRGLPQEQHDIQVPAPGPVRQWRSELIDWRRVSAYDDAEVQVRLREYWGRFCLMRWLFSEGRSEEILDLTNLPTDAPMRCGSVLNVKHDEIHAMLWRLRFEQQQRQDAEYRKSPQYLKVHLLAAKIPVRPLGKDVADSSDMELLLCACEYAGMLGTLRWVMDSRRPWGDPSLMDVADHPFPS